MKMSNIFSSAKKGLYIHVALLPPLNINIYLVNK